MTSYAGLDVVINDSGIKKGNKFLRKAVFMLAPSTVKNNHEMKGMHKCLV